jgi:hypothetical protein
MNKASPLSIHALLDAYQAQDWRRFSETCRTREGSAKSLIPQGREGTGRPLVEWLLDSGAADAARAVLSLSIHDHWKPVGRLSDGKTPLQKVLSGPSSVAMVDVLLKAGAPLGEPIEGKSPLAFFLIESSMGRGKSVGHYLADEARSRVVENLLSRGAWFQDAPERDRVLRHLVDTHAMGVLERLMNHAELGGQMGEAPFSPNLVLPSPEGTPGESVFWQMARKGLLPGFRSAALWTMAGADPMVVSHAGESILHAVLDAMDERLPEGVLSPGEDRQVLWLDEAVSAMLHLGECGADWDCVWQGQTAALRLLPYRSRIEGLSRLEWKALDVILDQATLGQLPAATPALVRSRL